jgi:anti-anti-sigma regulatory factor
MNVTVNAHGREHLIDIDGQIDERAQLVPLAEQVTERVVIDLERVSFINSVGVREWIRFLRALADKHVGVTLRRCSEAMVNQLNMIVDTSQGAVIESFFAPYACAGCGRETSILLEMSAHRVELARLEAPEHPCPGCNGRMQLGELPQRYLLFVSRVSGG